MLHDGTINSHKSKSALPVTMPFSNWEKLSTRY